MLRSAALVVLLSFVALVAGPKAQASLERTLTTSLSAPAAPDAPQWSRDRTNARVQPNPKLAAFEIGLHPQVFRVELALASPAWRVLHSAAPAVRVVDQRQIIRRLRAEHRPLDAPRQV